ncbi:hypothetical protein [Paraglaciecola sp. 2405UD69-4]|uniref:hypothetical protein n=1 Tax=Paraglaciecola sp. 2405UD69-4 TaxID=3391836 RepID=UPI0039C91E65
MLNVLSKQKRQLEQAQSDYLVASQYVNRKLNIAKGQTKAFAGSPKGLISAFSAGAMLGASPSQAKSISTWARLFPLLSELL